MATRRAFTVIELLVVIVIVGVLAGILLTALSGAKGSAEQSVCLNNLRQINLGVRMYSDDSSGAVPNTPGTTDPLLGLTGYKKVMESYLRVKGTSVAGHSIFACPMDTFHFDDPGSDPRFVPRGLCQDPISDYSSYGFNGGNAIIGSQFPGIAGRRLSSIKAPARTVLVLENSGFIPWSWHQPKRPLVPTNAVFNDAINMSSFVDGHAASMKVYWRPNDPRGPLALCYDPPGEYVYKWSAD
jgi:prepilin-type N-terminal cleavage/methylation domain-containing protein